MLALILFPLVIALMVVGGYFATRSVRPEVIAARQEAERMSGARSRVCESTSALLAEHRRSELTYGVESLARTYSDLPLPCPRRQRHHPGGLVSNVSFIPGRWYVMDRLESTADRAYVAGPFTSQQEAEIDRTERNIADDCDSWQCPDDRVSPTDPSSRELSDSINAPIVSCHHCSSLESSARQTLAADGRIPAVDRCLGCGLLWRSKVSEPAPVADPLIPEVVARYADARGYSGLPAIAQTFVPGDGFGWSRAPMRPTLTMAAVSLMSSLGITSVSVVWPDSAPPSAVPRGRGLMHSDRRSGDDDPPPAYTIH